MDAAALIAGLRLRRDVPVALHHQILQAIKGLVDDGVLRPGDRLPTVPAISRLCGVSYATAMRAIAGLGQQGVLISKPGVGTHVAERMPGTTEVMVAGYRRSRPGLWQWSYVQQIMEGLRDGYHDPGRGLTLTYMHRHVPPAASLVAAARARGVDGMVVHEPVGRMQEVLRGVARELPCVSLLASLSPQADCVVVAPAGPLREMLHRRIAGGRRAFAYVGFHESIVTPVHEFSPYAAIHRVFLEVMRESGMEPMDSVSPPEVSYHGPRAAWREFLVQTAGRLPDGCVVLTEFPSLAEALADMKPDLDLISYTDCRETRDRLRGVMSLLYLGLDDIARAAVPLLRDAIGARSRAEARVVRLVPQIVEESVPERGDL